MLLGSDYLRKIQSVRPESLIALWPQNEPLGHAVSTEIVRGYHGAYTAVTLGQPGIQGSGMTSAGYNGATAFNNIYSVALNAMFDGSEGTALIWQHVNSWVDATARCSMRLYVDANNEVKIERSAVNNRLTFTYESGGVVNAVNANGKTDTGLVPCAITWSKSADEVITYYDGTQNGAIQNGLGIWAGNLNVNLTVIGAGSTGAAIPWHGRLAPGLVYSTPLTADQIAYLSEP